MTTRVPAEPFVTLCADQAHKVIDRLDDYRQFLESVAVEKLGVGGFYEAVGYQVMASDTRELVKNLQEQLCQGATDEAVPLAARTSSHRNRRNQTEMRLVK